MKLAAKDNKLIKASKHETRVGLCDQCAALLIAPYFFSAMSRACVSFFQVEPYLDPLSGDPRFETLVSRILSGSVK
jgi:hypothetical protein